MATPIANIQLHCPPRHSDAASNGSSGSSPLDSAAGRSSYDAHRASSYSGTEIVGVSEKRESESESESSASECSVEVDLEAGGPQNKVHLAKFDRDCRICHLSFDDGSNPESGAPIELGCSCKDDLAAAHKHCAEAWFKIKGNKTCEICGSVARNVIGVNESELMNEWNIDENDGDSAPTVTPAGPTESRNFWQGHRFLNFLLACMVFAFVISWLFHFNVPS